MQVRPWRRRASTLLPWLLLVGSGLGCISASALAAEPIELQSRVTGNQEQPKVLYIVPWKSPGTSADLQLPLNSQLSTLFQHVERSELVRELHYRAQLNKAAASDD